MQVMRAGAAARDGVNPTGCPQRGAWLGEHKQKSIRARGNGGFKLVKPGEQAIAAAGTTISAVRMNATKSVGARVAERAGEVKLGW